MTHRTDAEIGSEVRYAIWLYYRVNLGHRDIKHLTG
jgi:hypothetical protein